MKPDIYINPSDIQAVNIVNVNDSVAKYIVEKNIIKEICDAFNHIDVTKVKDYDKYRRKSGGSVYEFHFEFKNSLQKVFCYKPGECISNNGEIYETTNTEIEKFWDIVEPITEWTPEHAG